MLGTNTRKFSVYGKRRNTRIVSVQTWENASPAGADSSSSDSDPEQAAVDEKPATVKSAITSPTKLSGPVKKRIVPHLVSPHPSPRRGRLPHKDSGRAPLSVKSVVANQIAVPASPSPGKKGIKEVLVKPKTLDAPLKTRTVQVCKGQAKGKGKGRVMAEPIVEGEVRPPRLTKLQEVQKVASSPGSSHSTLRKSLRANSTGDEEPSPPVRPEGRVEKAGATGQARRSRIPRRLPSSSASSISAESLASSSFSVPSEPKDAGEELADRLDELQLSSSSASDPFMALLSTCGQDEPGGFDSLLDTLETLNEGDGAEDLPHSKRASSSTSRLRKIGEASYSEVYRLDYTHGSSVLKVIPLRDPAAAPGVPAKSSTAIEDVQSEDEEEEWPEESDVRDVNREVQITRVMGELGEGFVQLKGAHIVRGPYPDRLLAAWDAYDKRKRDGSENVRPDCLPATQTYAILVLADGGPDLESVKLSSWVQAASVFWQVVQALATAEKECEFEHRDLHWGNILVSHEVSQSVSEEVSRSSSHLRKATATAKTMTSLLDPARSGVRATIIDFTLSRLKTSTDGKEGAKVVSYTFDDEEIFEGEGDLQFDVYRLMRERVGDGWKAHCPFTNVMWLHYLATKLLEEKKLARPGSQLSTRPASGRARSARAAVPSSPVKKSKPTSNSNLNDAALSLENSAYATLLCAQTVLAASLHDTGVSRSARSGRTRRGSVALSSVDTEKAYIDSASTLMSWAAANVAFK